MAMSKKYSRRIVVDGITYRWRIPPGPDYDPGHYGELWATVWCDERPECILYLIGGPRPDNWHHVVEVVVTPRDIAAGIRAALQAGWNPGERGGIFSARLPTAADGTEAT